MKQIPYGTQDINEDDVDAVLSVLKSAWLTQGPSIEKFEMALKTTTRAGEAVAVSNATAGLHLACLAIGLGPGDRLWTSPNTFVASANCGLYCGATVDFVDIDPVSFNMSVDGLRKKLERAAEHGELPKVVIPVHFAGQPCDMEEIHALSRQYGFHIIEDAAHALGAKYRGEPIGSGRYSDATVFSFHPVKIITTGEGGAVVTNNPRIADCVRLLRSHGITRSESLMQMPSQGRWYYEQLELGYNFRMTDLQAALGVSQMTRLADFIARRNSIARHYGSLLSDANILIPEVRSDRTSAWHLYVVLLADSMERRRVFDAMRQAGILANVHYIPVHLQPWYRKFGFKPGDFPEAERYYARALTIPIYPGLGYQDLVDISNVLRSAVNVNV